MSFESMANTIRNRFKTEVVGSTGLVVAYDNAPCSQPEDAAWVRFTVLPGDSFQASMGAAKRYRTPGVAIAQIFQPINQGDKDSLTLADRIKLAFRSKSVSGLVFGTPSLARVGRTQKWNQMNLSCPFYADEIEGV